MGGRLLAAVVFFSAVPQTARAQVHAGLDWQVPGCIDAELLTERVQAQLGRVVFEASPEILLLGRSHLVAGAIEISLTLTTEAGALLGRRTLVSETLDCRTLDDELVVVVSLLVDLPEEEILLLVPAEPPRDPPESPAANVSGALAVGVLGSLDAQPGVSGTIVLGGEVSFVPELTIDLSATVTPPVRAAVDGIGATFVAWTVRPGICGQALIDIVRLGGCARLGVGTLAVESDGLDPSRSVLRPWVELSVGARIGVRWDDVEVRITGGALVPFLRDAFVFGTPAVHLHQASPLAPFVEVAVAYHFGS